MHPAPALDWRFETPRLQARFVDSRDRDLYRSLYTDPAVMAHIGAVMSHAEADEVFGKVLGYNAETPVRARYWRLSDRSTDEVVGIQSFIRPLADPASLELGMMLLPQSQGQGLGIEASQRLVDLLLGNHWGLDIETVFARHAETNARVARLGATLGFDHVDRPAQTPVELPASPPEEWRLSRQEWRALRSTAR
ncbi:MAG: GNAT family N-acetyltransferase [Pseudomonadota bacterium]